MAYTPCPSASISENAVKNCENPSYGGLKVMAVLINKNDIETVARGTGAKKNTVSAITLKTEAKTYIIEAAGQEPWAGTAEEFDPATLTFTKTATFIVPNHGGTISGGFIEPALKNRDGFVVILQRKNDNGDMAYPIIGLERGAIGESGSLDYNDVASGGCYVLSFVEKGAASSEIDLFATDIEATRTLFEGLVAKNA